MAIFKSFKTIVKNLNSKSRTFLSFCASATPFPYSSRSLSSTFHHSSSPSSSSSSSIFPFSYYKCIPFTGPLFLSSPPWQLSQSATPLYLHSELVLRKAESFNSRLIQRRVPLNPGFGSGISNVKKLVNRVVDDEQEDGGRVSDCHESFFNIPNLISLSRLVSGPFIGWMIVNEWYLSSFVVLAVSGATDWLDGYMARKMGINSVIGSYLDPLADKVLIGCVALAMVERDLLPTWLVGLVLFRDVGLISGAVYKRASDLNWQWKNWSEFVNLNGTRPQKVEPLFISKVNTVFQLALVAAALLQPELGTEETQQYITSMSWLVASTTAASTIAYGVQHMQGRAISAATASISRSKSV